jgi:hypothetical protein
MRQQIFTVPWQPQATPPLNRAVTVAQQLKEPQDFSKEMFREEGFADALADGRSDYLRNILCGHALGWKMIKGARWRRFARHCSSHASAYVGLKPEPWRSSAN